MRLWLEYVAKLVQRGKYPSSQRALKNSMEAGILKLGKPTFQNSVQFVETAVTEGCITERSDSRLIHISLRAS